MSTSRKSGKHGVRVRITLPVIAALLLVGAVAGIAFGSWYFASAASKPYVNADYGFSVNPPRQWSVEETGASDIVAYFHAPGRLATISIGVDGLHGYNATGYADQVKAESALMYDNFKLVANGTRMISGLPSAEFVATYDVAGKSYKEKQVMVFGDRVYIMTFVSSLDAYDLFLLPFDGSARTFKLAA